MARPRVNVTLSPHAMEVYASAAKTLHLPLPTFLRQCLEEGVPFIEQMLATLRESDPQKRLVLAKGVQQALYDEVAGLKDDDAR